MKRINVNVRPSDGYWYRDASGTKFSASSWAQVVKKLIEFRRANGKPVGNAQAEVMDQACSRHPQLCHEQRPPTTTSAVPTLKGRVLHWLAEFSKRTDTGVLDYVKEAERNDRVNRCIGCPLHGHLPTSCAACIEAIKGYTANILRRDRAPDRRVAACTVLGIYLPVATWLDEPRIKNDALPGHCWRKQG